MYLVSLDVIFFFYILPVIFWSRFVKIINISINEVALVNAFMSAFMSVFMSDK